MAEFDGAAGDVACFEGFYAAHRCAALALACSLIQPTAEAEDAVQDAFVEVWRRWGSLRQPRSYLMTSVRNGCLSEHRRVAVRRRGAPALQAEGASGPGEVDYLADVVGALPRVQRQAVLMRVVDGWSIDQTASAIGVAPGTVKSCTHRGLAKMRAALEPAA